MYNPDTLTLSLNSFSDVVAQLAEVECGEYCSCGTYEYSDCFAGKSIQIETNFSDLTFTAIWSDLGNPYPEGSQVIIVLPPGGFASSLHERFRAPQRMAGDYGNGPDFINFEPHEWPIHAKAFFEAFDEDFVPVEELEPLPEAIRAYIIKMESIHESMKPAYVCPNCHDASCEATTDKQSPCSYTDEL